MNTQRWMARAAVVSLVFVYLVILAGSVVRMTGSGMGCPDWPQCFGLTIPPTHIDQVTWHANTYYSEGQMIVHEQQLLVAPSDFTSGEVFDASLWRVYDKHDYATFNPKHTWVEFINRLIGALTGLPVLLLFVFTVAVSIKTRTIVYGLLGAGTLFMLGFEAWLGKLVVDGNLIPGSITIHMLGSVLLIVLLLTIIRKQQPTIAAARGTVALTALGALLLVAQIVIGTQVREEVDLLLKAGVARDSIIEALPTVYFIHRSFSWVNVLLFLWWFRKVRASGLALPEVRWIGGLFLLQLLAGITLAYGNMPEEMQPVHLLSALLLFGAYWSAFLRLRTIAAAA